MSLMVSVVVPTYRRPQLLDRCLQALLTQAFPPQAYEIIVVDDDPQDALTRQLVEEWQARLQASYAFAVPPVIVPIPVTGVNGSHLSPCQVTQETYAVKSGQPQVPRLLYLPVEHRGGPAAARNQGWRAAAGEIIAFTDDDCLPEPDWLANGVAAFVDGVAGVSGRVIVPVSSDPTDHELNYTGLERSDFVTANCFYRRSVLAEVGGFDERFATAWREDSDLYFSIRERNYLLAWARGAIVVHPVRSEPWGSSLRAQRKSFYNALLYKKHPGLYWRYIQAAPPWRYYAVLAALLVIVSGLWLAKPLLFAIGLGAWLYLIGSFIYHRLERTSHAPNHVVEMVLTSLLIPFLSVYWRVRGALHWRVFFL